MCTCPPQGRSLLAHYVWRETGSLQETPSNVCLMMVYKVHRTLAHILVSNSEVALTTQQRKVLLSVRADQSVAEKV
ncbi:hypothetical protein WJX79_003181 [Trebouxia sp. C0005]